MNIYNNNPTAANISIYNAVADGSPSFSLPTEENKKRNPGQLQNYTHTPQEKIQGRNRFLGVNLGELSFII
jgi:hypothetical protein